MSDSILTINLYPPEVSCVCCGGEASECAIPMYEGMVIPNDWTGPWGGFTVCKACFDAQEQIREPVSLERLRQLSTQETEA